MNRKSRFFRIIFLAGIAAAGSRLTFAQGSAITATPAQVFLCGQPGQAISGVPVALSNAGGPITFLATGFTAEGNWLTVEPNFVMLTAGQPFQLLVGLNGPVIPFATGDYHGQIVLANLDGAKLLTIPVLLQISLGGCGAVRSGSFFSNSGAVTIQLPPGAPANQNALLLSIYNTYRTNLTAAVVPSTSTGQNWLTTPPYNLNVVTGLLYPASLAIGINSAGLAAGAYTGNLELDASNAAILNIPVTLNLNPSAGGARFAVTPSPLSLGVAKGTVATNVNFQLINLTSTAADIAVRASAENGKNWLAASPSTTVVQPNATISLTATITAAELVNGPNKGAIDVQVTSGTGGAISIPVTVNYGISSDLSAIPNPVNFTIPPGASTVDQVLTVSAESGVVSFEAIALSSVNQPWLSVKPFFSTATPGHPATLTVGVQPALLPAGPAFGTITLKRGDGAPAVTIPVNVNSGKDLSLSVMPAQLALSYPVGTPFPQTQSLSLTTLGNGPANYTVQATTFAGGQWLTVSPPGIVIGGGNPPAKITAQVNPGGLSPNTYRGQIIITNASSGEQQTVPVTLTVGPPLPVSANPAALTFTYQTGAPSTPPGQPLQVSSTGGSTAFSATTAGLNGAPNFLTVDTLNGNTPATVLVGLSASTLAALPIGEYSGMVTIVSPGIPGGQQTVAVTLLVSPAPPRLASIVNSASLSPGPVSPGEIVTIYGTDFGPSNVTVALDGFSAPLTYAGANQINAVVPYEIAGRAEVSVSISRNGLISAPVRLPVADAVPAIFAATPNGSGQGAILNADNSDNGGGNPAAKGSVIQIFATGEGLYPGAITGALIPVFPPFPAPVAPVAVTIGGVPAQIQYVGEVPGLLSGLLQVNAFIPADIGSGPQRVVLTVADKVNNSQTITVAVE